MRKLQTQDVFKTARIIKTANIREDVQQAFKDGLKVQDAEEKEKEKAMSEIGINVFMQILEACGDPKLEEQVYDLLGGVFESSPEDVKQLSLDVLIENVKKIMEQNDIVNFLRTAARLKLN